MADIRYDFALIGGQVQELEKIALSKEAINLGGIRKAITGAIKPVSEMGEEALKRSNKAMNIGRAAGAVGGAGIGAGSGYLSAGKDATPEQRRAAMIRGGLVGAGAGLAGGQLATSRGRQWLGNVGKRQVHGMTGWMPGSRKAGKGFFGGGMTPEQRVKAIRDMEFQLPSKAQEDLVRQAQRQMGRGKNILDTQAGRESLKKLQEGKITGRLGERFQRFMAGHDVKKQMAQIAQAEQGATSIPGFVKGMVTKPGETVRTGARAAGGLGLALPVAFSAPALVQGVKEKDPKAIGGALTEGAFYTLTGGMPMAASIAGGIGARALGELPGRGVSALTRRQAQPAAAPRIAQPGMIPQG